MNSEDGKVYSACILKFSTVCSQNINKQNVKIADETLTDFSFLSRYHYTKSKNSHVYWDTLYDPINILVTEVFCCSNCKLPVQFQL